MCMLARRHAILGHLNRAIVNVICSTCVFPTVTRGIKRDHQCFSILGLGPHMGSLDKQLGSLKNSNSSKCIYYLKKNGNLTMFQMLAYHYFHIINFELPSCY